MIEEDKMGREFNQTCLGQESCQFNLAGYFRNIDTVPDSCRSAGAKAYIQFGCELGPDIIK